MYFAFVTDDVGRICWADYGDSIFVNLWVGWVIGFLLNMFISRKTSEYVYITIFTYVYHYIYSMDKIKQKNKGVNSTKAWNSHFLVKFLW